MHSLLEKAQQTEESSNKQSSDHQNELNRLHSAIQEKDIERAHLEEKIASLNQQMSLIHQGKDSDERKLMNALQEVEEKKLNAERLLQETGLKLQGTTTIKSTNASDYEKQNSALKMQIDQVKKAEESTKRLFYLMMI
jgi:hypothetical protein